MYNEGYSIAEIAARVQFSPYLLARLFVENYLHVDKRSVGKAMKDISFVQDDRLRADVSG